MKKSSVILLLLIYLGVYGSQLALWDTDKALPVKVFPYEIQLYPVADQEALRHGIPITSPSDLQRISEDYFS